MYCCMLHCAALRCIAALQYSGRGTQRLRCIAQYSRFFRCIAIESAALVSRCIGVAAWLRGGSTTCRRSCRAAVPAPSTRRRWAASARSTRCARRSSKGGSPARKLHANRDRDKLEKVSSRWCEALAATWRVADGPNLIFFSNGGAKIYKCSCTPDRSCTLGCLPQPRTAPGVPPALAALAPCRQWRCAADGG